LAQILEAALKLLYAQDGVRVGAPFPVGPQEQGVDELGLS
jgi:hypothetical protein